MWCGGRRALLNLAAALLLAAGLPLPAPSPARPPTPCAAHPLCSCTHDHMTCAAVPLHTLPVVGEQFQHVVVSRAHLLVLEEGALEHAALQTLVLVAARLDHIQPRALRSMVTTLASLDLGYNEFTEVPIAALRELRVLNWLSLQNNQIRELSPDTEWGWLARSLSVLSLSHNLVCVIRAGALSSLRRLVRLELESNRLRVLAGDALPSSLRALRLADNLLPCAFHRLPRLLHMHLRNNLLRAAHNRSCLHSPALSIQSLDLSSNDLDSDVHLEFLRYVQVKQLVLDLNNFTDIPTFVYENKRLVKLSIAFNKLTYITDVALLSLRHNLQQLELDHNKLAATPPAMRECLRLRRLSLAYNLLEEVTYLPPHLQSLSLAGNFIRSVPYVLKTLSPDSLIFLDLSYNQITQLSSGDFDAWSGSLTTLNLKSNQITELYENVFPVAMPLREMILSFNDLYYIDQYAFLNVSSTLQLLEFSSTLFSGEFPITLNLGKLSWMSFDNNNIHVVTMSDLQAYPSLEHLNLEFNKIMEFPTYNYNSNNVSRTLKDLRLGYNLISKVNSNLLTYAAELRSLDISHNRMHNLSEHSFTHLPNLVYLKIARNIIEFISDRAFYSLPRLEVLDLRENDLEEFSTNYFDNVSNVDIGFSLNISCNKIRHMTGDRSVTINVIDVSHNFMTNVPKSFFISVGSFIKEIIFSYNKLVYIENSGFGSLPKLEILYLNNNNISAVKRRAFSEMLSLKILDLSHNSLSQLSVEQFLNMRHLCYLKLNNNLLCALPRDVFRNTILEHIDLAGNRLGMFPSSALAEVGFTLRYLDVSRNLIEYLDSNMFQSFFSLLELHLSHNMLTVLSDKTFSCLTQLRRLGLSGNYIKTNFKELFRYLPYLKYLDLAHVGLKSVPYLPLANLTYLDLFSNHISSFKEEHIKPLQNLRVLNLGNNSLGSLAPAMWVNLGNLSTLDISSNPVIHITNSAFKGLENLTHLKLRGLSSLEAIDYSAFLSLQSLRRLDIELPPSGGPERLSLAGIFMNCDSIEELVVIIEEEALTWQLEGAAGRRLREVVVVGVRLRTVARSALESLGGQRALVLRMAGTALVGLPRGLLWPLAHVPRLALDLSHSRITTLAPAAFYPNATSWTHRATNLLSDGLMVAGNPLQCGCEVAWLGAWLRRWLAESGGGAGDAREAARAATCLPPRAPPHARPRPLLQEHEAECHASALSSPAPRHRAPLFPALYCVYVGYSILRSV